MLKLCIMFLTLRKTLKVLAGYFITVFFAFLTLEVILWEVTH